MTESPMCQTCEANPAKVHRPHEDTGAHIHECKTCYGYWLRTGRTRPEDLARRQVRLNAKRFARTL